MRISLINLAISSLRGKLSKRVIWREVCVNEVIGLDIGRICVPSISASSKLDGSPQSKSWGEINGGSRRVRPKQPSLGQWPTTVAAFPQKIPSCGKILGVSVQTHIKCQSQSRACRNPYQITVDVVSLASQEQKAVNL